MAPGLRARRCWHRRHHRNRRVRNYCYQTPLYTVTLRSCVPFSSNLPCVRPWTPPLCSYCSAPICAIPAAWPGRPLCRAPSPFRLHANAPTTSFFNLCEPPCRSLPSPSCDHVYHLASSVLDGPDSGALNDPYLCLPASSACMHVAVKLFDRYPFFFQESSFFSQDIYANTSTRVGSLLRRHAGR